MEDIIKERFWRAWNQAGARVGPEAAFEFLDSQYSAPCRFYHNWSHIADCLEEFDSAREIIRDPAAVELSLFYHDSIYDPMTHDNEEMSAWLMAGSLAAAGVERRTIDYCRGLVLATKHDCAPVSPDARVMCDIDLAIFGQSPERFDDYDSCIWKEYAWMGPIKYTEGRIAVLERFLQRNSGHIYYTGYFREKYERPAASNLIRMINILRGNDAEF